MARMHARKKGKSGSTRPVIKSVPSWVTYSREDVINLVLDLSKKGMPPSKIGLTLRDQYGIPSVKNIVGMSILDILKKHDLAPEFPEDLMNLFRRAVRIRKHLAKNTRDIHNRRGLQLTEMKIRRLLKYYKRTNKVPGDFYYDPEKVELLLR